MELSDIQQKILKPFAEETIKSLKMMAGLSGHCGDGFPDDITKFKFKGYAVVAETFGALEGKILMHHYVETALGIGNRVRAELLDASDEEIAAEMTPAISEALEEFSNTAIGLAMRALGRANLGIKFRPPYFVNNTESMETVMQGVGEILSLPVHVDGIGRFYFNYLIHRPTQQITPEKVLPTGAAGVQSTVAGKKLPLNAKIMIVDDMRLVRSAIKSYLGKLGYTHIIEAGDGAEAVEKHAMEEPAFIFMDIIMNQMNGNEALKHIRDADKTVPIVMLTSVADDDIMRECTQLGIGGYILKPLTQDTGPETLARVLEAA